MKKGFTLIELLIVVAIIGILAAIAVPNFLNAQVRAKVARVQGDFRTIATALEMYRLDNGRYISRQNSLTWTGRFFPLTTPVSYVSNGRWPDPFAPLGFETPDGDPLNYVYESNGWVENKVNFLSQKILNSPHDFLRGRANSAEYALISAGPDTDLNAGTGGTTQPQNALFLYDSSNGTNSVGDIIRFGP